MSPGTKLWVPLKVMVTVVDPLVVVKQFERVVPVGFTKGCIS